LATVIAMNTQPGRKPSILVLGGGVAGLATALALGRDGHEVTLVERDEMAVGRPEDAFAWHRDGIRHFLQPHAFTPRGRQEMRATFPDVFEAIIAAGAWDLDLRPKMRDTKPREDDDELVFLAVRRPIIEWALRQAVIREAGIRVVDRTRVTGLVTTRGTTSGIPRVTGADTTSGSLAADLVIDAMGRGTPTPGWIAAAGVRALDERSNDCAIIYYCRYYHVLDGATLPDGPWLPSPRGDLGYAAFSTFPGDNRTFCALVAVPPGDQPLKILRDARAFDAAVRTMPALDAWTNPETAEPITPVLPMGSLQNILRSWPDGRPSIAGLISVGDAVCHTDPVASLGLAFALIHARLLVDALRLARDPTEVAVAFDALAKPEMEERFGYVSAIDATRHRLWRGETIDYTHASGPAYPFFGYAAAGLAPLARGDLFRVLVRRNYFLDPLAVLDEDGPMQRRLEDFYAELRAANRPKPGPPREELVAVMTEAIQRGRESAGR
jgi:2-polyprenyl-6-methoxyphenol hydroxylase-like FAD-dependent oxidoreductase